MRILLDNLNRKFYDKKEKEKMNKEKWDFYNRDFTKTKNDNSKRLKCRGNRKTNF